MTTVHLTGHSLKFANTDLFQYNNIGDKTLLHYSATVLLLNTYTSHGFVMIYDSMVQLLSTYGPFYKTVTT